MNNSTRMEVACSTASDSCRAPRLEVAAAAPLMARRCPAATDHTCNRALRLEPAPMLAPAASLACLVPTCLMGTACLS